MNKRVLDQMADRLPEHCSIAVSVACYVVLPSNECQMVGTSCLQVSKKSTEGISQDDTLFRLHALKSCEDSPTAMQ